MTTSVYFEIGKKRVFASALDWPGWCRSGTSEESALEAMAAYAERYAPIAREAAIAFPLREVVAFDVVERVTGSVGYTDFGAPGEPATSDGRPLGHEEGSRIAALVLASWNVFDRIAAQSPPELRKGPRGGGRDRDKLLDHVLGAEAAYARKIGVKQRQPSFDDADGIATLHGAIVAALKAAPADAPKSWPPRYAARRIAWHVLDHAWEMQDRSHPAQ